MPASAHHGPKFDRKQEAAIGALLTCDTMEQAAKEAKVSYRALKQWLADPTFQAHYRAARREILRGIQSRLIQSGLKAVNTLVAVLDDAEAPTMAKVSAARAILAEITKTVHADDLDAKLAELEARLTPQPGNNGHVLSLAAHQ